MTPFESGQVQPRIWVDPEAMPAERNPGREVSGVLTWLPEERCLVLETSDGTYPVLWPAGTWLVDADPVELQLGTNGVRVRSGHRLSGSAALVPVPNVEPAATDGCVPDGAQMLWFTSTPHSEAESTAAGPVLRTKNVTPKPMSARPGNSTDDG